ncbi:MAG: hypothetical protein V4555_21480 [Acidobacteriota bacterium]
MSDFATGTGTLNNLVSPLSAQTDNLLQTINATRKENGKVDKSAADFESILLSNWLQQAEESFGSLPGGDDSDADAGAGQMQGIAMQSLGAAMTASGGIGIAKMISTQLHHEDDAAAKAHSG